MGVNTRESVTAGASADDGERHLRGSRVMLLGSQSRDDGRNLMISKSFLTQRGTESARWPPR